MDLLYGHFVFPLFLLQFAFKVFYLLLEFAVNILHALDFLRILRLRVILQPVPLFLSGQ